MALFEAAAASLDNVYLTMTAEVAADYIGLRTAQEEIRIAEQNLKLQEDIYDVIARQKQIRSGRQRRPESGQIYGRNDPLDNPGPQKTGRSL